MGKQSVGVGVIGFGTVGQGTCTILQNNADSIERHTGLPVRLVSVADIRAEDLKDRVAPGVRLVSDASELIADPEVDIVCELIGGVKPAGRFVREALSAGKAVVTANKELVAKHGPELLELASKNRTDFYFEASVGGGIPIISPLGLGLAGNDIVKIVGIVNGTTNFILTKMAQEGGAFSEVLAEAQKLGYAEADPTNDIEGYDARYKITILASLGFHARIDVENILCEGITGLQASDVAYARKLGYEVKLLAIAKKINGAIEARVHPALVPLSHPLASVSFVNNAIYVTGNAVGDCMFFGPGAGGLAAGSAVVGDVVEISRNLRVEACGRLVVPPFRELPVLGQDDITARYYVRMKVADRPNVLAAIAREFGQEEVSIATLVQQDARDGVAEIIFMTHQVREQNFQRALKAIAALDAVKEVCSFLRVEE